MSIDAIGSTALKTALADAGHSAAEWASAFNAFLPEVAVIYREKFSDATDRYCEICTRRCVSSNKPKKGKQPKSQVQQPHPRASTKVWKYIGDEVVLVADLTCKSRQAALHVLALAETIEYFNDKFSKNDKLHHKLSFKGTAWVAAFPVTNIELNFETDKEGQTIKDYLGPSIDLGFRLSKLASDDRLVISASLAYLIVSALAFDVEYKGEKEPSLPLCFGGTADIKGVKGGKHPLIWFSVKNSEESKLCHVKWDGLKKFLLDIHFNGLKGSVLPFIFDADDKEYNTAYDAMYRMAVKKQKQIPNSIFRLLKSVSKKQGDKQTATISAETKDFMESTINKLQTKLQHPTDT